MAFRYTYEYFIYKSASGWSVKAVPRYYNPDYVAEGTEEYQTARYPAYRPEYGYADSYTEERIREDLDSLFSVNPPMLNEVVADYLIDSYDSPQYPKSGTDKSGNQVKEDPIPNAEIEEANEDGTPSSTGIEYKIQGDPTLVEKTKGGFTQVTWDYIVTNNINLPNYTAKKQALANGPDSLGRFSKANKYAQKIGYDWETSANFPELAPKELNELIFEVQKEQILKEFKDFPPRIKEKSYKNENYPKEGTPKELYNQDPISYTFSSIVVDQTTQEPISGVKIKDLDKVKTKSDADGFFELTSTFTPGKVQKLILNVKKYGEKIVIITTLNGSIRSDINIIELIPDTKNADSGILKAQGTSDEEKERLSKEEAAEFVKKTAEEIIDEIKKRAIPYAIKKLLCEPFGVCDPLGLIEQAKELKNKAKNANQKRKEKKEEKQTEKELKNEVADNQDGGSSPSTNEY